MAKLARKGILEQFWLGMDSICMEQGGWTFLKFKRG